MGPEGRGPLARALRAKSSTFKYYLNRIIGRGHHFASHRLSFLFCKMGVRMEVIGRLEKQNTHI